jgi:hypothetical protein
MKQLLFSAIFSIVAIFAPLLTTSVAYAACPTGNSSKGQVLTGIGETGADCSDTGVTSAIQAAVSILSFIAGVAAVVMVILSGFKYITSGGDANKVSSAKSTLVYALVGVAIAALAQALIHFVIQTSDHAISAPPAHSKQKTP